MVLRAIPVKSALRSRVQFKKVKAPATEKGSLGRSCHVVLTHSQSSSGITSRARLALSRAAAQDAKIDVGSDLS
jgi:hypothetical protein